VPLVFDNNASRSSAAGARKTDQNSSGGDHERANDGSHHVLHISTTTTNASVRRVRWRTRVLLPAGTYFFEGDVRGTGIVGRTNVNEIGFGAGPRLSGDKQREKQACR